MLNVKYWRIVCDVISMLAQVFIVSFDRAYKEESTKNIEIFLCICFWDMTVPVTLTVDIFVSELITIFSSQYATKC